MMTPSSSISEPMFQDVKKEMVACEKTKNDYHIQVSMFDPFTLPPASKIGGTTSYNFET
jgi:hypothetical protein